MVLDGRGDRRTKRRLYASPFGEHNIIKVHDGDNKQ